MSERKMTYKQSGVNYDVLDLFKILAQTAGKRTGKNIRLLGFKVMEWSRGESAFLIQLGRVYLAHVQEGLGTKNLVADAMYKITKKKRSYYDLIAQDTAAMIINDIITVGAWPLSLAMHLSVGDSNWLKDELRYRDLLQGWETACHLSGCVAGPGETPTLKDIVNPLTCELSGSALGLVPDEHYLIRSNAICHGDAIIFLTSSGIHANGLTMARNIAAKLKKGYLTPLSDGLSFGESLLEPTHIYAKAIRKIQEQRVKIHYAVNITGHGYRKLMRANHNFNYVVETLPAPQPIFEAIQSYGKVSDEEMYGNFNMGAGFGIYIAEKDVERTLNAINIDSKWQFRALRVGYIEKSKQRRVTILPLGISYEAKTLNLR